ncbi:hypothetical protein [Sulfuracidifex tepidarius]|nr:hypothetical protein [Sulfuracidifex tepidarius]
MVISVLTNPSLIPHLSQGSFVEYKIRSLISPEAGESKIICKLLIENVTKINNNGTFVFSVNIICMNNSIEFPTSSELDNLSYPKSFYYIPTYLLGKGNLQRVLNLSLNGEDNGVFTYYGTERFCGAIIQCTYFVNSSGVPSKIIITQTNDERDLIRNATYNLIPTSFLDEEPVIPPGLKPFSALENIKENQNFLFLIRDCIIPFNLIAIPLIIVIRRIKHA